MKIIVGLGNPGEKYSKTRHNVGFVVLDKIIKNFSNQGWSENKKFQSLYIKEGDFIFIKPLTYMNNSGQAVQAVMSYYKLLPKKFVILKEKNSDLRSSLLVLHDDIDIDFGKIKKTDNSGSAGHNGIKSIINHLGTKNFSRLRIGIKQKDVSKKFPMEKYVLGRFSSEEQDIVENSISSQALVLLKEFLEIQSLSS
jgi:PTH1 family peptidyl-tRNA hydrolase